MDNIERQIKGIREEDNFGSYDELSKAILSRTHQGEKTNVAALAILNNALLVKLDREQKGRRSRLTQRPVMLEEASDFARNNAGALLSAALLAVSVAAALVF